MSRRGLAGSRPGAAARHDAPAGRGSDTRNGAGARADEARSQVPPGDASAGPQKLLAATEGLGTLVLLALGALFAIGTLIVNIHLGTLGLSDFSGLRPRFVLVGLTFLIYAAIPPLLCLVLLEVGRRVGFRRGPLLAAAAVAATAVAVMTLVAWMLFFALPHVTFTVAGGRIVPPARFWTVYTGNWYAVVPEVAVCVSACILFVRHGWGTARDNATSSPPRHRVSSRVLVAVLVLGLAGLVYPYASLTYMNISRAAGGGQPGIVLMTMERDAGRLVDRPPFSRVNAAGDTVYGPFLVWHENEDRTYLSFPTEGRRSSWEVYGIRNEKVHTTWHLPGGIRLENVRLGEVDMWVDLDWPAEGAGPAPPFIND